MCAGGWGFSELRIDESLLGQGRLAILSARGVLPDGTPFDIPGDDPAPPPLTVDGSLRDALIYLALPLKRAGTRDTVEEGEAPGAARYISQVREVRDDGAGPPPAFDPGQSRSLPSPELAPARRQPSSPRASGSAAKPAGEAPRRANQPRRDERPRSTASTTSPTGGKPRSSGRGTARRPARHTTDKES